MKIVKNATIILALVAFTCLSFAAEPIRIGSRLEPLVDEFLIDEFGGKAKLKLHKPTAKEVVLVTDMPWEGNTSAYYTVFQDGDIYRMYYRGSHFDEKTKKAIHEEVTCYAESKDGVHWTKPELGLFQFDGSKTNNIVWNGIGTHCFTAFKDGNPKCSKDARYKAIARGRPRDKKGLYVFKSPDAIHWSLMHDEPVITTGAFDSQNLAFWDNEASVYREYHRTFVDGVRAIMTGTSDNFLEWTDPVLLEFGNLPKEHLYTNAVRPYERAPHILIGFPTRYLPNEGSRVEPVFMSSRDGLKFRRWTDALISEDAPKDRNGNRSNYMTWGLVRLPGNDKELSVYATEAYYTGPDSRVRRFTFRVDGFTSVHATSEGGEFITKPLVFDGNKLVINFATKRDGYLQVEIQDQDGTPIDYFTLADSNKIRGDNIQHAVSWSNDANLGSLAGKPVRLRFSLKNADLYSLRFSR